MLRAFAICLLVLFGALHAADKPETQIRVVGARTESGKDIISNLGGRLDHITLHPTTPWRASDAAFLVEQHLQNRGFNEAKVTWKILGARAIELTVSEGERDELGEVTVEDVPNPKLNKALSDLFALTPGKRASKIGELPLRDEDVDAGIALMEQQMKSIGFYDAKISVKEQKKNPETGKIDFTFSVDAGGISMITTPRFEGAQTGGLKDAVGPLIGKPATGPNLNSMRARVSEAYTQAGFIAARIRMKLEFERLKVRPVFEITEGRQFELRSLTYTGLEKTDSSRISARLDPLKGGILDGPLAQKRIGEIIATGAFESVRTDFNTSEGPQVDATLHFKEGRAKGVSFTAGFDTFEGAIFGASYYDRNFRGKLRNFSAGFEISQRSLLGDISLTDPWLFGSDLSGTGRIFAVSKDYDGFDTLKSGIGARIDHRVTEHYSVEYGAAVAYVTNTATGLPPARLGDENYINAAIRVTQLLDHRDNPLLPTNGWHLAAPIELGVAIGDDTTSYLKMELHGSWHYSLSESSQFSVGGRGGILIPNGGTDRLPIDLRFFTGGANSVRSFRERELGPWSFTGYPIGGEAYWVTNFEYTRRLAGPLRGVVFVDAGGLSQNWEDFGFTDPEVAVGLGLRINLPIGPARLEYGHNLTQDGRDPSGTWHFAIGATF